MKNGALFDATKEPLGWRDEDFNDSAWAACVSAGAWWQKPVASEIPPRMEVRYPSMGIVRKSPAVEGNGFDHGSVVTVPAGESSFAVRFDRVLSGYVTLRAKTDSAAVMKRVMARTDLNCQPYFMHFVFDALAAAGPDVYAQFATPEMRRWEVNPVTKTAREMWANGDWSHGWVATPVVQMSERILGVVGRPTGIIEILPNVCDLAWAKGSAPAGDAKVEVSWKREGPAVRVEVEIPPGRTAVVSLAGQSKQVTVGGGRSVVEFP